MMGEAPDPNTVIVDPREGGQKLLQFLQRRLDQPPSLLHRWIRTGQVRINGGRAKPFGLVAAGDSVRLPPFALGMSRRSKATGGQASPEQGMRRRPGRACLLPQSIAEGRGPLGLLQAGGPAHASRHRPRGQSVQPSGGPGRGCPVQAHACPSCVARILSGIWVAASFSVLRRRDRSA